MEQTGSKNRDELGLLCKRCGCRDLRVSETRKGPGYIVRWRKCRHCGHTFKSFER